MKHLFEYKDDCLAYTTWGESGKVMFMFHGFGQESSVFNDLAKSFVNKGYKVYAFDLFFHGDSKIDEGRLFLTDRRIADLFNEFRNANRITLHSILSFSIGAKYAMVLSKYVKVENLILIAPDGIVNKTKYNIITSKYGLRGLFKYTVTKPALLFVILKLVHRLGFIPSTLYKFSRKQMSTESERRKVYHTWVSLSKLKLSIDVLERQNSCIFLGRYDKVIQAKKITKKLKNKEFVVLRTLECGHSQLISTLNNSLNNLEIIDLLE